MGNRIPVLDHGFVELLDMMGDDREAARAARISYGTDGGNRPWEADAKLTKYLFDNEHMTPFEMIELKFRMKMPIFVARQLVRHRTANINEFSMRYADPERLAEGEGIDYYTPIEWRVPDPTNKQGSLRVVALTEQTGQNLITERYRKGIEAAIADYKFYQEQGIANELARCVLPVSVYTEWIWKCDLRNTLHLIHLRDAPHAQWETQEYASAMLALMRQALPKLMEVVLPESPIA